MSEVNQAFLRAYLKNRTAQPPQASIEQTGNLQTETMSPQVQQAVRPVRPGQRPSSASATPAAQPISRSIPSSSKLRVDPSHRQPRQVEPAPVENQPTFLPSQPTSPQQGVWSPLGVERGMKSMESMSVPAVVRNGVDAVSSYSAQSRSPLAARSRNEHVSADVSYDQVMFVDGLQGHSASHRETNVPPTERTLAEITEPIAFGTGSPAPTQSFTPHAKRSQFPSGPASQPPTQAAPEPSSPLRTARSYYDATTMRFDPSHATQSRMAPATFPAQAAPTLAGQASTLPDVMQARSIEAKPVEAKPVEAQAVEAKPAFLPVPFSPSWEVDCFFWPEVVKHIEASHGEAFRQIGKHLSFANRDGLKVMAITSGERGVGRSTVAMHMARCAASSGLRVALVDGDTFCPSLVDQLRLDMEHGWQDCLFENVPLHEAAIHSIADGITLFPLTSVVSPQQMHVNLLRISKLIKRISNAYDMVFIDANRLNLEQRDMVGVSQETIVDAAIVVVDTELSIKEKVDSAVSILQSMGLSSIGLVENFQS